MISFKAVKTLLSGTALAGAISAFSSAAIAADYDGPQITFEQIYASPDDQQLNLNYARQQAAAGDYISAASALERMLFSQPDWDSARLFYALVLYKLDDRQAAFSELDTLEARPLSADQMAQVKAYRNEFAEPVSGTKSSNFSGRVAFGVRTDDNAGNALIEDILLSFANVSDSSAFIQGNLLYSAPLAQNGKVKFRIGVNGQARRHETFSRNDYDTFSGNVGFTGGMGGGMSWAIDAQASQTNISGRKYLSQVGGQVKFTKSLSSKTTGWVSGGWYDQTYKNLPFTFNEPARSGDKILLLIGATHKISENANYSLSAGYEDKNASNQLFAYNGLRAQGNFFNGFNNGIYMRGNATYRKLDYKGPTPNRKDDHIYGRLGFGTSLNTIGSWMGMSPSANLDSMYLEIAGNYTNRDSNLATLKYENKGVELKFLWDF